MHSSIHALLLGSGAAVSGSALAACAPGDAVGSTASPSADAADSTATAPPDTTPCVASFAPTPLS